MTGMGTVINSAAVLLGGLLGLFLKKGISNSMENALMKALGISTMFIGLSGALTGLLSISEHGLDTKGSLLMIVSLVAGTFVGELIKIEEGLEKIGESLKKAFKHSGNSTFVEAFVTETVVICVGAMAIVGSLEDGLSGDYSILLAKSTLDAVISVIFASTLGVGALFAVIPMFVYQGSITLLAGVIKPFLELTGVVSDLSYIGSVLIFAVGVNLFFGKQVKCANMLPSLLVPIIYRTVLLYV